MPDRQETRARSLFQDMKAIQLVWDITNEWNEAWQVYKTANFWAIEMEEMETTANVLFRKLNRLSRELKEKNWEIVEHSRFYTIIILYYDRLKKQKRVRS